MHAFLYQELKEEMNVFILSIANMRKSLYINQLRDLSTRRAFLY